MLLRQLLVLLFRRLLRERKIGIGGLLALWRMVVFVARRVGRGIGGVGGRRRRRRNEVWVDATFPFAVRFVVRFAWGI
jgi:hypothetical protein